MSLAPDRPATCPRLLYILRHAQAEPDGSGLTEAGRRQAVLLGRRLRDHPFAAVHHSPLPRAAQTAQLIAGQHAATLRLVAEECLADHVPYFPRPDELPADAAPALRHFVDALPDDDRERGPRLARALLDRFAGPAAAESAETAAAAQAGTEVRELVVTHAFQVGWLLRDALGAPAHRWLGLNAGNAALTAIRYAPGMAPSVLVYNDTQHLSPDLQWTGFPDALRP